MERRKALDQNLMNISQKDTWTKKEKKDIQIGTKKEKTGKTLILLVIGLRSSNGYILHIKKHIKKKIVNKGYIPKEQYIKKK